MHYLAYIYYTIYMQNPEATINKMKKSDVMRALTGYRIMHILGPSPGLWISTAGGLKTVLYNKMLSCQV